MSDGLSDVLKNLGRVEGLVRKGAARGLALAAEYLLEQANRDVPIQDADLLRSGVALVDVQALVAAVVYDMPYAVRQHEDTTLKHDDDRTSKWLEKAAAANKDALAAIIAKAIREEIERA